MAILDDLREAADALRYNRHHVEPRHEWHPDGTVAGTLAPHRTTQPSLLQQLRDMCEPGADGEAGGAGGPESVPLQIDAASLLASITVGVRMRSLTWQIEGRDTLEDQIGGLIGAANTSDRQKVLCSELRSWRYQAEVVCGWKDKARPLPAPCPECHKRGSLMARVDGSAASCVECGHDWDEVTVHELAKHVTRYREQADAANRQARTRAVAERRRRNGERTLSAA